MQFLTSYLINYAWAFAINRHWRINSCSASFKGLWCFTKQKYYWFCRLQKDKQVKFFLAFLFIIYDFVFKRLRLIISSQAEMFSTINFQKTIKAIDFSFIKGFSTSKCFFFIKKDFHEAGLFFIKEVLQKQKTFTSSWKFPTCNDFYFMKNDLHEQILFLHQRSFSYANALLWT